MTIIIEIDKPQSWTWNNCIGFFKSKIMLRVWFIFFAIAISHLDFRSLISNGYQWYKK